MFFGLILTAVFEANDRAFAKGHQVGQEKPIRRFNFVLVILGFLFVARADRVTDERQRHVAATPIIAATTPFLGPSAAGLRRLAVVEEEARITFERVQHGAMRKNPRGADEVARPVAAVFGFDRVEQHKVFAGFRTRMIAVSGVEVSDVVGRFFQRVITDVPSDAGQVDSAVTDQFDLCRLEKRHGKVAGEMDVVGGELNDDGKALDQIFAIGAVVEGSRAEEERNRRIHGRVREFVPREAQAGASEPDGLFARHGKLQGAKQGWLSRGDFLNLEHDIFARRHWSAADLFQAKRSSFGRARPGSDVCSRSREEVQHILVRRRCSIPRPNRM